MARPRQLEPTRVERPDRASSHSPADTAPNGPSRSSRASSGSMSVAKGGWAHREWVFPQPVVVPDGPLDSRIWVTSRPVPNPVDARAGTATLVRNRAVRPNGLAARGIGAVNR
jgi:hypothetical protein